MSGELHGLTACTLGNTVLYFEALDGSTNQYLKENGEALPHGTLCYTGWQKGGRGRLGRNWHVEKGQTLAMSLLFKPAKGLETLPLLCGLAVAEALERLCGGSFQIKWPNDIVCGGRKICGILCESRFSENGGFVVAGIGVNLRQNAEEFERQGLPDATSVMMETGRALGMEETAVFIINALEPLWLSLQEKGFQAIRSAYETKCANIGQMVQALTPTGDVLLEGQAAGIADDGCLLIKKDGRNISVNAGEVSIRGLQGYVR